MSIYVCSLYFTFPVPVLMDVLVLPHTWSTGPAILVQYETSIAAASEATWWTVGTSLLAAGCAITAFIDI